MQELYPELNYRTNVHSQHWLGNPFFGKWIQTITTRKYDVGDKILGIDMRLVLWRYET